MPLWAHGLALRYIASSLFSQCRHLVGQPGTHLLCAIMISFMHVCKKTHTQLHTRTGRMTVFVN